MHRRPTKGAITEGQTSKPTKQNAFFQFPSQLAFTDSTHSNKILPAQTQVQFFADQTAANFMAILTVHSHHFRSETIFRTIAR